MISVPAGVRIYLALEPCDMRKGFDGLSLMVQQSLGKDPFSGHLFLFRGQGNRLNRDEMPHWRDRCLRPRSPQWFQSGKLLTSPPFFA